MLGDEQRRGLIREDADIELTAVQILAVFDGVQLQWLLDPEAVDLVGTIGDYLHDLQARLAPVPAQPGGGGGRWGGACGRDPGSSSASQPQRVPDAA